LLGLHLLLINKAGIHGTGIESQMIAYGFVGLAGPGVTPGGVGGFPLAYPHRPVLGHTFKLAKRIAGRGVQEFLLNILRRKVINRRVAGLQDTLCLPRLSNGLSLKNYSHSPVGVLNPRGPGIIPDRFFGRVGIGRHRSLALLSISNLILPNSDPFFEYALR
jgi:hypothetical protein